MFNWLFKRKKNKIKPKYKKGYKCIWKDKLVVINDYMIDGDTIKYIVIDLETNIIYEWIDENELYNITIA